MRLLPHQLQLRMQACLLPIRKNRLPRCCNQTCLYNVDSNVVNACINLLLQERWRDFKDILHTQCILSRQSSRSGHCIASVSSYDLLVSLEAPGALSLADVDMLVDLERMHTRHPSYPSPRSLVFALQTYGWKLS
jgi:hypothetical protein